MTRCLRSRSGQTELVLTLFYDSARSVSSEISSHTARVQNTHNSLDVLADTHMCLRIVDDQHVFVFSKQSHCRDQE